MTTTTFTPSFTTTAPVRTRLSARRRGAFTFGRTARSTRDCARVSTAGHRTELRSQAVLEAVAMQRVPGALR